MKIFRFLSACTVVAAIAMALPSCNNSGDEKKSGSDTTNMKKTDTSTAMKTPAPPGDILIVMHKVKDYDKWLTVFERDDSIQKANGLTRVVIGKGLDDPSMVLIGFKMTDYEKAKAMSTSQGLKDKMTAAGVIGAPMFHYIKLSVMDTTTNSMLDRLIVFSTVKDFAAWEKEYTTHGDVRKNGGTKDRGYGHDYSDDKKVFVVLGINDLAKARDFSHSPQLKERMDSAGVVGKPDMFFYHVVKQY